MIRFKTYVLDTFDPNGGGIHTMSATFKKMQEYPEKMPIKEIAIKILKEDLKTGWGKDRGFCKFEAAGRMCLLREEDFK